MSVTWLVGFTLWRQIFSCTFTT